MASQDKALVLYKIQQPNNRCTEITEAVESVTVREIQENIRLSIHVRELLLPVSEHQKNNRQLMHETVRFS